MGVLDKVLDRFGLQRKPAFDELPTVEHIPHAAAVVFLELDQKAPAAPPRQRLARGTGTPEFADHLRRCERQLSQGDEAEALLAIAMRDEDDFSIDVEIAEGSGPIDLIGSADSEPR